MAISRPLLLALIAAVLAAGTFLATIGARQDATDSGSKAVAPPKSTEDATPDKLASPRKLSKATQDAAESKSAAAATAAAAESAPAKPAKPVMQPRRTGKADTGVPAPVERALADKQVLVLFFRQAGGADDSATADAVRDVRGTKGVKVISDVLANLPRYRSLVQALGIAQAPTVVIVDRKRQARLVEGYVDPGTLKQLVLDAR